MRLLATFAAMATVNAVMGDDFLKRIRRDDDDDCAAGEVEVNGLCIADSSIAAGIENFEAALEDDESDDGDKSDESDGAVETNSKLRRFPMSNASNSTTSEESVASFERAKRRAQRITLIMAICPNGTCPGKNGDASGPKLKPRDFMKRINNYGCHCWTKGKMDGIGGAGLPVDDLDKVCAKLSTCHTCIGIDFGQDQCDPVTQRYKAKLAKNKETGNVEITCSNTMNKKQSNNGDCKRSLCECDKQFADSFADHFHLWDGDNWNLNSDGEFSSLCHRPKAKAGAAHNGPPDTCCGPSFPEKRPFNSITHKCTEDNEVLGINSL